ncbi:uncharacterized protein STEHIDRAFT_159849 [Stereum hirsutum FP-91666 SS1]|uniref:uncharacterized protein n=1 Tax=Stereum hirsutum (strain FP-91666) TaxID=721885 RepID=UPI000444A157|nr:uncharacterized protein STEHIDRAFT_159849 [Stereum hirsutum FP-91666 SS1]EIM83259.1 hypothetical protein STEHIDRAFT_159849 [Stereum hirsutum FP-91666 SS1]
MATSGIDLELLKAMMTPLPETFGSESETSHDSTNLDYSMDEGSVNSFLLSLLPNHGGSSDAIDISDIQGLSRSNSMLHRMSIDIPGTSQTLDMYLEDDNDGDSTDDDDYAQVPLLTQSFSSSTLSSSMSSSSSISGGIIDLTTPTNLELQSNGHAQFQSKSQSQTQAQTPFISNHTVLFTPSRSFSSTRSRNLAASLSQIRVKEGSAGATVEGDSLNPFAPSFRPKLWWIGAKPQEVPAGRNIEGHFSPKAKSFFTPPSNVNGEYGRGHGRGHGYGYGTRESMPPAPVMMMPAVSEGAYDYGKGVERQDSSLRRRRMGYY